MSPNLDSTELIHYSKPVHNNHLRDQVIVVSVDRWSLSLVSLYIPGVLKKVPVL